MIDDQIRKYVRAEVDETDNISVQIIRIATMLKGAEVKPIKVKPLNISARGVKFESELDFGSGIMLDLLIGIEDKTIQTTCKIVRKEFTKGLYHYAVTFSLLKEYNVLIISNFVKRKMIDHIQQMRG